MKKGTIALIVVVVLILLGGCSAGRAYNKMVTMEEGINKSDQVIEARSRATQVTLNAEDITSDRLQQYQQAQGEVSQALGRLMMIAENYPDLKANQNFMELQAQLEGTENRISVARKDFNDASMAYNSYIRKFPANIIAGIFGFDTKSYFEAAEGTDRAPEVNF